MPRSPNELAADRLLFSLDLEQRVSAAAAAHRVLGVSGQGRVPGVHGVTASTPARVSCTCNWVSDWQESEHALTLVMAEHVMLSALAGEGDGK